jgi:molybdopterin-guanine dinucleotide biosynthesis protein A
MGREKGLVTLHGKPMIQYVADTVSRVADEVIVAVAPDMSERYAEVLGGNYRVREDARSDGGPIEGLITALSAARGDYVVICPCDTPFLRAEVVEAIARFAKGQDGAIPIIRGYIEPLHSAFRRTRCLPVFENAVEEGTRKLADAYAMLNLVTIDEDQIRELDPELESFWNLNTPEDISLAEKKLVQRRRI